MTGNRAFSFEQSWRDLSEPLVHPVPCPLARTRGAMTEVAAQDKNPVIVKMLFFSLQGPRSFPINASDLGQSAQSSYCCPASCGCSMEWVSGQEFFMHGDSARAAKDH